jgi:hypothetical protein
MDWFDRVTPGQEALLVSNFFRGALILYQIFLVCSVNAKGSPINFVNRRFFAICIDSTLSVLRKCTISKSN